MHAAPIYRIDAIPHFKGRTVLVGGCFDIVHVGHIRFLQAAKRQGDHVIVLLESDEFIRSKKKRAPVNFQHERAEILSVISCVDSIIMLPFFTSDDAYFALVKKIHPTIIAVTSDDPFISHKKKQAREIGARVQIIIDRIALHSTSNTIYKIKNHV